MYILALEFFTYIILILEKLEAKVEVIMLGCSREIYRHVRMLLGNNYKHSIIAVTQIKYHASFKNCTYSSTDRFYPQNYYKSCQLLIIVSACPTFCALQLIPQSHQNITLYGSSQLWIQSRLLQVNKIVVVTNSNSKKLQLAFS